LEVSNDGSEKESQEKSSKEEEVNSLNQQGG
jgi:hypothetical protein